MPHPNKILLEAFRLLDGFESATRQQKQRRIVQLNRLLRRAKALQKDANLALRTIDQIRKERAYMLISAGRLSEGIAEIESIVRDYEGTVASIHDEAAFQLAEAALSCFNKGQTVRGFEFARSALAHAGNARALSQTLVSALQAAQDKRAGKRKAKR